MSPELRIRPPEPQDEAEFRVAHEAKLHDYTFALGGYDPKEPFAQYCDRLADHRSGRNLAEGNVAATFLIAIVDESIVGRVSIRFALNDFLKHYGGHIGYAVLPDYRGRGYATEILRQAVIIARAYGVADLLLTCDDDNLASATTIERCGGVFDKHIDHDGTLLRHYWIR